MFLSSFIWHRCELPMSFTGFRVPNLPLICFSALLTQKQRCLFPWLGTFIQIFPTIAGCWSLPTQQYLESSRRADVFLCSQHCPPNKRADLSSSAVNRSFDIDFYGSRFGPVTWSLTTYPHQSSKHVSSPCFLHWFSLEDNWFPSAF